MEAIFEFIILVVFEFLLEVAGELMLELGLRSLGETIVSREHRNPLLAGIGYALLGLIGGGLSLLFFPNAFARSEALHGISLLIAPVLTGLAMAGLGWLWEKKGRQRLPIDSFAYGFIFALPMAIVRFLYTS
ncbi:MAG TPA: hypothetical protein VGW58_12345 [Pyrinomonadaceae bacterium]|nr:hypothetical protein [Pyrinomonadaceae bacterium]